MCLGGAFEASEVNALTIDSDARRVLILVSANALKSRSVTCANLRICPVLRTIRHPKIREPIVRPVSVIVVDAARHLTCHIEHREPMCSEPSPVDMNADVPTLIRRSRWFAQLAALPPFKPEKQTSIRFVSKQLPETVRRNLFWRDRHLTSKMAAGFFAIKWSMVRMLHLASARTPPTQASKACFGCPPATGPSQECSAGDQVNSSSL